MMGDMPAVQTINVNTHFPYVKVVATHFPYVKVVATGGDAKLGGDDFTSSACHALLEALPTHVQLGWKEGR